MTQRWYLHNATTTNSGTMPGAGTISTLTSSVAVTGSDTNRDMNGTAGVAQVSQGWTTLANTAAQPTFARRWVTAPIAAQTIASTFTWTISLGGSESSTNSNLKFISALVALWRPSTGSVITRMKDNWTGSPTTPEAGTAQTALSGTQASSTGFTSLDGDILVVELWRDNTVQTMGTGYTNTIFYDGTTEGSATNIAAYIDFGTDIAMSSGVAARVPFRPRYPQLLAH